MCGIFCVFNNISSNCDNLITQLKFEKNLKNRGPDNFNFRIFSSNEFSLLFAGSVLWLQGLNLAPQPIEDADSIFCYNGDIFNGFDEKIQQNVGDTKLVHDFIKEQISANTMNNLINLHGPYAFIYFAKKENKLYFSRDIFGRRSLLLGKNEEFDTFIIVSVAKRNAEYKFIEIPSIGIFSYDLSRKKFQIELWPYRNTNSDSKLKELEEFLKQEISIKKSLSEVASSFKIIENHNLTLLKQIENNNNNGDNNINIFNTLLAQESWRKIVENLHQLLENAVKIRIATQPKFCKNCMKNKTLCSHTTTGILFSGGVDCTILAALCNKFVEDDRPIDLLNVSFDHINEFKSPDRITGLQSFEELKSNFPNRKWNFVEINVTPEELNKNRDLHIADLIYPLNKILDDSLGCALWFASKGEGKNYISPSRILIIGTGADELFGGYTKHRTAFKNKSLEGLQEFLEGDWMNLPYRNLGRDDRVISDHGKQLRTPYLDENLVEFLKNLQCWEKSYPSERIAQGVGDKILLRCFAHHLGLKKASILRKKALQFGSRIANSKENAHEISPRLC